MQYYITQGSKDPIRDLAVSARFRASHRVTDPTRATKMLMSVE